MEITAVTLTKTIRFDDDVLSVIRAMSWEDNGCLGRITSQLERRLYEKVNKALELMGGKWNRKSGGHVFAADPRPSVEGLIGNGALTVERDGFFETPPEVTARMLELVPLARHSLIILEPSAGKGAILKVLLSQPSGIFHLYHAIEKNDCRREILEDLDVDIHVVGADFLSYDIPCYQDDGERMFEYDRIYMNPPFEEGQDIDHVRHAYGLLKPGGALVSVMCEGEFFRNDKKAVAFRDWATEIGATSERLPADSFKASGTNVNARLFVARKAVK